MIDELHKLPENMDEWNADTVRTLNKIFEHIYENSVGIEYTSTAPTEVPYGKIVIQDDGTNQNIYFRSGQGTVANTPNAASSEIKCWVNFNGTGTIDINDSLNVSSLTDNDPGYYDVNWDRDFATANYACNVTSNQPEAVLAEVTAAKINTITRASDGTPTDASIVMAIAAEL